ncbi:MAG: MBL fold metallo-hydrolase [Candidatus Thiodiazotropha sp.]|jgi:glyoxylase-like metal-dependent hydrolase (beta-lactamase superfamily II)
MPNSHTTEYAHQITCIDTFYRGPEVAACYLLQSEEEAVFIDTGTSLSTPHLMTVLEAKGIQPSQVKYVIPTHVHLDHAGGAGTLMQQLPEASLVIHPYGAKHLIDPSKLSAGAAAVYGEEKFKQDFGEIIPIAEERVIEAPDGFELTFGTRKLLCLDTPGHARHHICLYDELSKGIFSGDTFGISYHKFDTPQGAFILPTTTPIQLDPEAWYTTLDRLMALNPERIYLTHYGEVSKPGVLVQHLRQYLEAFTQIALASEATPGKARVASLQSQLLQWLIEKLQAHGCQFAPDKIEQLMAMDLELDAQGLDVWLTRREKA